MTKLTIEGILEDLKFAAEAGSDFDYELEPPSSGSDATTILATEYGDDGEQTGISRIHIQIDWFPARATPGSE